MPGYATKANAEAIANTARWAATHLMRAQQELQHAAQLAADDYRDNDEKLTDILGAVRLACSAVSIEVNTWDGFARNRRA